jgi:hypothetical protein
VTANPLSANWTISDGYARLAKISDFRAHGKPRRFVATIRTASVPPRSTMPLALAIVLTFAMIKADASIPRVDAGSGG